MKKQTSFVHPPLILRCFGDCYTSLKTAKSMVNTALQYA